MLQVCKLCRLSSDLKTSHIFPDFVIRWIKQTGPGYLRFANNPNRRAQDGPKEKLLCFECEQRFSVAETYFANQIFHPLSDCERFSLNYDQRLLYFAVSILWRILQRDIESTEMAADPYLNVLIAAEREWRSFLLEKGNLSRFSHIHLFVGGLLDGQGPSIENFNLYSARAIDGIVITDRPLQFVFAKFSKFMFIGILGNYNASNWINTKINEKGELTSRQRVNELEFGGFLQQRVAGLARIQAALSQNQKEVISQHFEKNKSKILNSDFGKALLADTENEKRHYAKEGVTNEKCSCGSGLEFTSCCGA